MLAYQDGGWWTRTDELLAEAVELAQANMRLLAALGGAKDIPQPLRVPRPGMLSVSASPPAAQGDGQQVVTSLRGVSLSALFGAN